jgi:hypothetical protein
MTKAKVKKCGPLSGNMKGLKWVVEWQSSHMPAPSFFYYRTKREAIDTARVLRGGNH